IDIRLVDLLVRRILHGIGRAAVVAPRGVRLFLRLLCERQAGDRRRGQDLFLHFFSLALGVASASRSPSTYWIPANTCSASAGVENRVGVWPIAQLNTRPFP